MNFCPFTRSRVADAIGRVGIGMAVAMLAIPPSFASSHREAPFIAGQAQVDGTDLYMFRRYETNRQDYVTVLANYQPF